MDVAAWEQQEQAVALLKILALGNRDIVAGQYRDAEVVLDELAAPAG